MRRTPMAGPVPRMATSRPPTVSCCLKISGSTGRDPVMQMAPRLQNHVFQSFQTGLVATRGIGIEHIDIELAEASSDDVFGGKIRIFM